VTFYFNLESLVLPTLMSIPLIRRLPGLSSVLLVSSSMVFRRRRGEA